MKLIRVFRDILNHYFIHKTGDALEEKKIKKKRKKRIKKKEKKQRNKETKKQRNKEIKTCTGRIKNNSKVWPIVGVFIIPGSIFLNFLSRPIQGFSVLMLLS
jgi:hypothetical protein